MHAVRNWLKHAPAGARCAEPAPNGDPTQRGRKAKHARAASRSQEREREMSIERKIAFLKDGRALRCACSERG